jgi:hypothetical protein
MKKRENLSPTAQTAIDELTDLALKENLSQMMTEELIDLVLKLTDKKEQLMAEKERLMAETEQLTKKKNHLLKQKAQLLK